MTEKQEEILRLVKAGVKRKDIAQRLGTSLSTISHTARVAGIFSNDSKVIPRVIEYLKRYPHLTLQKVAKDLNLSAATVSIAAANLGFKRSPVRRNPTSQEWECLELWLRQKTCQEVGDALNITRQGAYQAITLCCAKLGLQRRVLHYVTPVGGVNGRAAR